jgi:hypothetical protein
MKKEAIKKLKNSNFLINQIFILQEKFLIVLISVGQEKIKSLMK